MLPVTPLHIVVERAIEAVLTLDPDTRQRLDVLDGKLIRLDVRSPSLSLCLSICDGRVFVVGGEAEADTTLSGTALALRSLMAGNAALYRGEVIIEGDLAVGSQLKEILAGLDPDWEEALSPWLGDGLTHRLGTLSRQLTHWLSRSRRSLGSDTRDYLQEELEWLAPPTLVKEFCSDVDELRTAADRLAARVRRLEKRASEPEA